VSIECKATIKARENLILASVRVAEESYLIGERMHESGHWWRIWKLLRKQLIKALNANEFSRMRILCLFNEWGYRVVSISKLDTVTNYLTKIGSEKKAGRRR